MNKPSRILVCGGRDFSDKNYVYHILDGARIYFDSKFCIIEGGANGADSLARDWAFDRGVACIEVRAHWGHYGKRAGTIRNQWMLDFCRPDLVIAFEGGPGTADMKRSARMAGVAVYEI